MNNVLIINADIEEQEAIVAGLQARGISSRHAASEYEAVIAMQEQLPEIIIWDWPVRDIAPEIFLAILRQEGFSGTILICSASVNVEGIPFDLLFRKPYELDHLTKTVGKLLAEADHPACNLRGA
jgi:DNA-binding response OmpR family regulator